VGLVPTIRRLVQNQQDMPEHAVHVAHDVVIPKSQHLVIVIAEPLVPQSVLFVFGVLSAIDFDNKPTLTA
jgi:hypothetical protein